MTGGGGGVLEEEIKLCNSGFDLVSLIVNACGVGADAMFYSPLNLMHSDET